MRKLDLTGGIASESYARKAEDSGTAVAKPEALTPRVVTLRLRLRDPETGRTETIAVESTAPSADMRRRMMLEAARLAGGIDWARLPVMDGAYIAALARVLVQCSEIPKAQQWLLNDVGAVMALKEALVAHDQRYFRGDDGEGGESAVAPRVECPWPDAPAGGGSGVGDRATGVAGVD